MYPKIASLLTMSSSNVTSTYNVIEAGKSLLEPFADVFATDINLIACKLGVKKIIIASSETTYGVCFAQGDADYHSFPLEEDYDVDPEDSYALSKICGEKTARTVSSKYNI
jgi:nucleoside-diphosphate-sugar epimerase